jgi:osmoprotectant transport system permease protein
VFGCVCAAVLAIVLDQLIRLLEVAARRRSRALAWTGGLGLLLVIGGGLYGPLSRTLQAAPRPVIVGSADYTEQHILSEVIRGRLLRAGFAIDQRRGMGETIELAALRSSTIDCYVDYTGNIWATVMKRSAPASRAETLVAVTDYLQQQQGVTCLGPLGFENSYALAMPRARAAALGVRRVSDLRRPAAGMKIAADLQFFSRPEWSRLRQHHDLHFQATLPMDPALMYEAVAGERPSVDVIVAYTSDARIRTCDLVLLEDADEVLPHYDAVLLVSPRGASRPGLLDALRPLIGRIDVETMRAINGRVDVEKKRPRQAADELLAVLEGERGPSAP